MSDTTGDPPTGDPSLEEIKLACEEIRSTWSEQETISRQSYRLPRIKATGVLPAARAARDAKLERERERQRRAVTTR